MKKLMKKYGHVWILSYGRDLICRGSQRSSRMWENLTT